MKGAIILLLVLLMGFLTAQSFDNAFGYTPSNQDTTVLEHIFGKIDTLADNNPQKLESIHEKITPLKNAFDEDSKEFYILNAIYIYIDNVLYSPIQEFSNDTTDSKYSESIASALAEQF